ncbi:hypothetical protein AMS68_003588 [Peltaster fructicola]|uniref:HECT-type E3 ubiquitin transferase n=1 Tax=Peltaster fructicola TaxID=286661 RepID=A0A6H0XTS0_9PEZI|nr:hypothetical protein AMS68_003588 [Peltaster fructicola]
MGKIKKVPTERHNATASPAITEFVTEASAVPLHRLPKKLDEFPSFWPHPRGDLYHWIPLLDRFDRIFELFNQEYGLNVGPQTQAFERKLLRRGDTEEPGSAVEEKELDVAYPRDGDRVLIECILGFTRLLLERCGNRSLYASSGHINDLLHTTSLSLLQACLQLSLRLAQRYQVARFKTTHPHAQAFLLNNHYNINLDNMHKLAQPIHKPRHFASPASQTPAKSKDKPASNVVFNPADLVALAKNDFPVALRKELATVSMTYTQSTEVTQTETVDAPSTPTPVRRPSALSNSTRPGIGDRVASTATVDTPTKTRDSYFPSNLPKTYEISPADVSTTASHDLVREALPHVPKEQHFELLHRIRVAKAFADNDDSVRTLLNTRLLAISNLAYALSEPKFQERIGVPDSNEARRYHLAPQLCDLLQPSSSGQRSLPMVTETIVLETIESLARCKHKSGEIVDALAVSVNHGVLYYELRHAIASLRIEAQGDDAEEIQRIQWRNAIFELVTTISQITSHVKCAEKMVAAGIMEILVEALTLRTSSAERVFEKIMGFLTSFIHGISTAFTALASARGLEIITELASYEVTLAMQRVRDGEGMPERSKSKVVDYSIPYYQQATLRSVFKFVVYLFDHNSGVHDRLLRNLLDSPQTLGALREIIGNAKIFGSNVWDAAINTVTNFIHNEPTSFQVIAEAGLAKGILEAVIQKPLPEGIAQTATPEDDEIKVIDGQIQFPQAPGVLPVSETICDIPTAFGAICLNEDGMAMFLSSGALDAYLNIFLSPPHVRALEEEGQTAFSIGNAFDELSRHHPGLQESILVAVTRALKRVHSLISLRECSSSATLYTSEDDRVETTDVVAKALINRAPAIPYITAFFKFLEGFFHNSTMCQKFCYTGASSIVMDFITSPAVPYDLSVFPVIGKMASVINRMAEEKPHLILPDLLSRTIEATNRLESLTSHSEAEPYFKRFTQYDLIADADQERNVAKALANVCALCIVLSRVLNAPSFGARAHSSNQLLSTMNFADVYTRLFEGLGKVHSTCLSEAFVLFDTMPKEWKPYSESEALSVRNVDAEGVIHTNMHCAHCAYEGMDDRQTFFDGFQDDSRSSKMLAFKNIRLLRFLLGQVPVGIEAFFSAASQIVAPKRTADSLQKHHAAVMADSLATAVKKWFTEDYSVKSSREGRLKYLNGNLAALNKIFLRTASNMETFGQKEASTLTLWKFVAADGLAILDDCQTELRDLLRTSGPDDNEQRSLAEHGLNTLLSLYCNFTRSKCINDATQTSLITVRQPESADYFMPNQFLVELRFTIINSVSKLWYSDDITKVGAHNIKLVIEILRNVLKSEGEERAFKRSDKATRKVAQSPPHFPRRHSSHLDRLLNEGIDADLAREAIYRCYNHEVQAMEYCQLRIDHAGPRFAPPEGILSLTPTRNTTAEDRAMDTDTQGTAAQATRVASQEHQDSDDSMSDDGNLGSLGRLPEDVARQDLAEIGGAELFPRSMLQGEVFNTNRAVQDTNQLFTTVDDLNDKRDEIRAQLIDRCLEVLSVESKITFDLAELVQAALSTPREGAISRADWGNTLVSSLLSLQAEESTEATDQKIAAYAHLVALILQDHDFFEATLEELKDNFDALVSWMRSSLNSSAECAPWVEMILLIVERVLAEDEQPAQIEFVPPPADDPLKTMPEPQVPEQIVSVDSRAELFCVMVDILPKVGKQHSLALSACRILVILSRDHEIAHKLRDKLWLSRLFLMVRQLARPLSEKLQSAILLMMRHLVENKASIRQTMETEIRLAFQTVRTGSRGMDTTTYTRNLHHLVLRDPKLFVEVTKELVVVSNYNGQPHRPQHLALKPGAETTATVDQPEQQDDQSMPESKQLEAKPSNTESSNELVQCLLRELSNYKDVEDKSVPAPTEPVASSNSTSQPVEPNAAAEPDKNERQNFEPKDNVIYIYRCFIIQCLSELVGCYNHLKLEFINFSRKAEVGISTPSKPRSGTINYLLNQLLPVGTLEYRDTIEHRKKVATSEWATTLLVSLCSQTHEKPYFDRNASRDTYLAQEDSDLAFVRKFVLEHAIRSFKDALNSAESQDMRYSRLLALADLFDRMLSSKTDRVAPIHVGVHERQSLQIGRLMYEKNFVASLTSSIAELDLNFPNAKRAVKHILGPLKTLTDLAVDLSQRGELSSTDPSSGTDEDAISSATSVSDDDGADEEREQTPDLFRNSTLSMYEASGAHADESESEADEDEDEDAEMFEAAFEDEMEYEDGNGETISDDDDEDMEGMEGLEDMGEIEGLPGDMQMEVEIVEGEDDDDGDESEDDDNEDDDDDDEDEDDDDHEEDDYEADFAFETEEINGDDENASLGDMQEDVWNHHRGFNGRLPDEDANSGDGEPLDQLARIIGADAHSEFDNRGGIVGVINADEGDFFEDELPPEDDNEEGEEEDYEGEFGYEPEAEDDDDEEGGGWGFDLPQHLGAITQRLHRSRHGLEDLIGRAGEPRPGHVGRFHRGHHHHHHHNHQRGEDEGMNPLLQRNDSGIPSRDRDFGGPPVIMPPIRNLLRRGNEPALMLQEFIATMDRSAALPPHGQFTLTMNAGNGSPMRNLTRFLDIEPGRVAFPEGYAMPFPMPSGRSSVSDEALAVEFKPAFTVVRWEEEARLLYGTKAPEKASLVVTAVLRVIVPPAMELKRIKDAEKQREAAEEREREEARKAEAEKAEREAQEQKKKEEEEQARLEAEAAARTAESVEDNAESDVQMSGTSGEQVGEEAAQTEPSAPRITATIRGREVDITNLGIDHEYLLALPEEFREEVIMSQVAEQRSQAQQAGEAPNEISREFLEALPPEIQQELLRQEASERRRRERVEARRQAAEAGPPQPAQAQDMEASDFLAMLDPGLRQQILMDAREDENYLNQLPEDLQREARALFGERRPGIVGRVAAGAQPQIISIAGRRGQAVPVPDKARARPVVQMLDKAGVATLLRLMFITLHQSAKQSLRGILADVCKNTQNRAEVISILLSILQDGTADVNAVERSFAHLSLRAKQSSGPKTPQPLKRSLTGQLAQPVSELSSLNVVQQCLNTLLYLSQDNPKVQSFFLSEHETLASQKSKAAKKLKTKEVTAIKYPLNALLTILDRKLITENTGVMETLAALLSRVTSPLQILVRKAKQAQEQSGMADEAAQPTASAGDPMETSTAELANNAPAETSTEEKKRSVRELEAPTVPEENIRLVVNILAARECPSKTFSDTLDIIKHMAAIPGAKEVFGRELIRQASELGGDVVVDLNDLTAQINNAQNGADIQGMALVSFSSAGSKQRKLLRILVALDHLFDPKRMAVFQIGSSSADSKLKEDILASLYESDTFQNLWKDLSLCLVAIRQRGDLVNVATVLLPLIESLMVVCRNSTLKDAALSTSQAEVTVSTPPPEARMEGLFFTFTEEHRKILNELIRNNPKLMNGNLSVLAKNSKVLEFDNKRSYFNRKLHNRGSEVRVHHPPLTLNVRRDEVFMDSYKALFFKSGEEIKNGKLNIRFNGEEGIDAGGVSREWFAVMARQMFNPDFALFNPVASDRTTFHPNRLSDINEEHLPFFKFIGRVIGKALYEGRVLDCHFSRAVYRRILGKSVSLKDMESLDLEYYKSLVWILENDITDIAFETFSVEVDRFGEIEIVDLIENGRNIAVTEDNKQEYVRLVVEHRLIKSVEEQLNSFLKGFHDIIPAELISIFNEQELELLISGLPEIDVDDWKNNTEYHNYQATSAQIQWFWRAVKSFDPEERAKLLQFVTGTSKVPLNGFKELEGMNGFARFNIHRDYSSKEKLPTSHTCFNQLDLPEYESYEHLRQQLYTAITAGSEYFGFA